MKKTLRLLPLGIVFALGLLFSSCSDAVLEENVQNTEQESFTNESVNFENEASRCFFGGRHGHTGGNGISSGSYGHRSRGHGQHSSAAQ